MAQWKQMSQILQDLMGETVTELYPADAFPIEVRHYMADWIESHRWYDANEGMHVYTIMYSIEYSCYTLHIFLSCMVVMDL